MIKKKYILSFFLCCTMILLAGCADSRDLTEEQQDVIAEYAAGVVLQHDDSYFRRLVKQQDTLQETAAPTATPQVTQEETSEQNENDSAQAEEENQTKEVSLDDLYQVSGMTTAYKSYSVCQEYTQEIYAAKGECLCVVSFNVKNTTSDTLKVNLSKRGIKYFLNVDGEQYEAYMSLLKNGGMNYLKTSIKPNSSEKAVVIFTLPEKAAKAKKAKSMVLTIQDGEKTATIPLKS